MQVSATAQAFPVWQNGYTSEPVSRGSTLNSAVFAPVSQAQAASAGTIGVPQDRPGSKSGNGRSASDTGGNGTSGETAAPASDAANASSGTRVNRKSPGQENGNGSGRQQQGQGAAPGQPSGPDGKPLAQSQQAEVRALQARNRDVTAHEQAHEAAAGSLAGAISYTYERGPNGKLYAVGGDVPISINQDPNNPRKTVAQMRQVIAAALAPVDPSAQDRAVAARATQILLSAQRTLSSQTASRNSKAVAAGPSTTPVPASGSNNPVRLYSDVAQLGGTPDLNSGTILGLNTTA